MNAATVESDAVTAYSDDAQEYRALHAGAIVGLLVAVCSLVYPITVSSLSNMQNLLVLAAVPLAALAISLFSLSKIRANREMYTGARMAAIGAAIAAASLVGGTAYGGYVYATEVPDGYARTSFAEMMPAGDDAEVGRLVPRGVLEHIESGEKVFIKGYIRPDSTPIHKNVTQFLLVRDNNQCCFGDLSNVAYYDQVMVRLKQGVKPVDVESGLFRVGGRLAVRPGAVTRGEPRLVYELDADYIRSP